MKSTERVETETFKCARCDKDVKFQYSCMDIYHSVEEYPIKIICHYAEMTTK